MFEKFPVPFPKWPKALIQNFANWPLLPSGNPTNSRHPATKGYVDTLVADGDKLIKAWVNFNGSGTVAIRDSYNVSSITDNGTGSYTVNFTNSLPSANYAVSGSCAKTGASDPLISLNGSSPPTVSGVPLFTYFASNGALTDPEYVHVTCVGG